MLTAPDVSEPLAWRDRVLLELAYGAGMRVSELCGLGLTDLLLPEGLVRVFGKGSKERLVPIGRTGIGALSVYLHQVRPGLDRGKTQGRVLLNARGGTALARRGLGHREACRREGRGKAARLAPYPSPQLRHSPARGWRRPPGGAGDARTRRPLHHPDLHPRGPGIPAQRSQAVPSSRMNLARRLHPRGDRWPCLLLRARNTIRSRCLPRRARRHSGIAPSPTPRSPTFLATYDSTHSTAWDAQRLALAAWYFRPDLEVERRTWRTAQAAEVTAGMRPPIGVAGAVERADNSGPFEAPWTVTLGLVFRIELGGKRGARIAAAAGSRTGGRAADARRRLGHRQRRSLRGALGGAGGLERRRVDPARGTKPAGRRPGDAPL